MAEKSKIATTLSPAEREKLKAQLQSKKAMLHASPMSFSQQRLWLLYQLDPSSAAYNIPATIRLKGKINIAAFKKSLQEIAKRHEILRTRFASLRNKLVQLISSRAVIDFEHIDLRADDTSDKEIRAIEMIKQDAGRPFDLSRLPLFRTRLYQTDDDEFFLLINMHHIISDGWSIQIFVRELTQFYKSLRLGQKPDLSPLPIQFADFAKWQRNWLNGEVLQKQLDYWKQKLNHLTPVLDVPTDFPRPAMKGSRGGSCSKILPKALADGLKTYPEKLGVTPFIFYLAAFQLYLSLISRQDDIAVGSAIANRHRKEVEPLIGFFVNTLVFRALIDKNKSFLEHLQQVKNTAFEAYAHQDLPFEMLVEALNPQRDMSRTPLFQASFAYSEEHDQLQHFEEFTLEPFELGAQIAKFDLAATVLARKNDLVISMVFDADLYQESTIKRMLDQFEVLLAGILENPTAPLFNLSILPAEDEHKMTVEWTAPVENISPSLLFHQGVEQVAAKYPDALAVYCNGQTLTFDELNRQANRVARFLRKKGVGAECFVGLLLNRSVDLIVALLAIHKAGGAYVPADVSYPKERLRHIFGHGHVSAVLTSEELRNDLAGIDGIEIYALDRDESLWQEESDENLPNVAQPKSAAYAIYTSGSTGEPKGVVIQHDSLLNLAGNLKNAVYDPLPVDRARISLNAPLAFDASVQQVVMLMFGHALYIVPQEMRADAAALRRFIADHKLHVVDCVPSQLKLMIEEALLDDDLWRPLAILPGGEAIDIHVWQKIAHCDDICFYNMYGPTECTVDSTIHPITARDPRPVIGKAVQNARFYILDEHLNRMPIGAPGELFIAGAGLARGYFDRPDFTAERFLPDPFHANAGERMYKSGDLARFLPNGEVEFLGRVDFQVKVRGFRIELGEIEQALRNHPEVRDVIVDVRQADGENKHLVAYILHEEPISPALLRDYLAEKIPAYMIPAAFVFLESFPALPNGKIDRRSLPDPDFSLLGSGNEFTAPATPTEELLAGIFCDVLNLKKVSVTANFFELGGHSLLATQVISRIRSVFQVDLPLHKLFENADVRRLAQTIDKAKLSLDGNGVPAIKKVAASESTPVLSFAQQRMWFLHQLDPDSAQYHIPAAVRIEGNLDVAALKSALNAIVQRHETLRTGFITVDGAPKLNILESADIDVPVLDWRGSTNGQKKVAQRINDFARMPFELEKPPLMRAELLRLDDDVYVFELVMHHIISDGWSSGVLIRELGHFYDAMKNGKAASLPELELQYSDFAAWQRNWLQGERLQSELDYWKKQLGEGKQIAELPTDRPRPPMQTMNGAQFTFEMDEELFAKVSAVSNKVGATPFMVLLAAFQTLLAKYAGSDDVVVGTPIANRNRPEIENLIGFFVNTLALRTDLSGDPTFIELVQRVKAVTLDAYAHQDVPFDRVVEAVQPTRDTSRSPLFQVMFMMQNLPEQKLETSDIRLSQLEVKTDLSNFDLTLSLEEHEGRLFGAVEYNTDLFNESTMQRLVRHYEYLLHESLEQPQNKLSQLDMADAQERAFIFKMAGEERVWPDEALIHRLIEQQVDRSPAHPAVRFGGRDMTYAALEARANQLAWWLIEKKLGPDSVVGLCLERSFDMIVALLAVLKSGAGYLPLDPNYPRERIDFMLKDTGCRLVLTHDALRGRVETDGVETFSFEELGKEIDKMPTARPAVAVSPQNIAYVIYTSGSTGRPKGVLVTHESVVNHNNVIRTNYNYTSADRVLQFFSLNFDGAVEELFPTLMSGATLVLRPGGLVLAVDELLELCEKEQLTVLDLPTAYWHELAFELDHYKKKLSESIRLVIAGGEAALPERYAAWRKSVGERVQWLNTYGPTEGTVIATIYDPAANPEHDMLTMPIGKPLANDKIYIVDQSLNLSPLGVPGELCIGGIGVARGYLNRPDLTAEKFIPDPFSGKAGARLYRTGDLARWREDGHVEFIGRADDQVKIRGFRVELGEIETALSAHPDVRETAVVARQEDAGDKKLVAYVVAREGAELEISQLREFLKKAVPSYMTPHAFVILDALPKLISGKVDRRALPKPDYEEPKKGIAEPENETEAKLLALFKDILGRKDVGAEDNFFELGGDSIMSIQVIARAGQAGIKLTPRQLFEFPTVRGLASVAGRGPAVIAEQGAVVGELPLTPIMHWFFEQNFHDAHHWNQSMLLRIDELVDVQALWLAFDRLLEHHDALRLTLRRADGKMNASIVAPGNESFFHSSDLSALTKEEQKATIEARCAELQQQIDLERGPLMIAAHFDLGQESRLFIAVHHLSIDGVSWRILLEDLQQAYAQAASGQAPALPPKTTSFRTWAERLQSFAAASTVLEEATYWTQYERQLVSPLPFDYPGDAADNLEQNAAHVSGSLDARTTQKLLQELPVQLDVRINDLLLAGLTKAVNRWTGKSTALIDMESHGRENLFEDVDVSRTVGWFTALYPLLLKLERQHDGVDAVRAIQRQIQQLPRNGIGYGLLRYLSPDESVKQKLESQPQPQISFNYLGQFDNVQGVDSVFRAAPESKGLERSPKAQRSNLIDVTTVVRESKLHISITYAAKLFRQVTMQRLLDDMIAFLAQLGGQQPQEKSPTAALDKRKMDKVMSQLSKRGKKF